MVRANVDHALLQNLNLVIRGWAVDAGGNPVGEVKLLSANNEVAVKMSGFERPDLVRHFGSASSAAGFEITAQFRNQREVADFILSDPAVLVRASEQTKRIPINDTLKDMFASSAPIQHDDYIRGRDFFSEMIRTRLVSTFSTVFDVGANRGDYARLLINRFPSTELHAFEPVKSTFDMLQRTLSGSRNVHCNAFALGDRPGTVSMAANPGDVNNAIAAHLDASVSEKVEVQQGDKYCATKGIRYIDFLKVDTEGYDLNVLKGFSKMLKGGNVRIIQVEAGMNRLNKKHVRFIDLYSFLIPFGYEIFGIYEQIREYNPLSPVLRRADVVFINTKS